MNIIGIATLPEREKQLIKTVKSLINQCDFMFIALNNYDHFPKGLENNKKITFIFTDNSKGDAFKFFPLNEKFGENDVLFTCDDDLIYPKDYVKYMNEKLYLYGRHNVIVSLHGRDIEKRISNYYKEKTRMYHCLWEVQKDVYCKFLGTGVMAATFKTYGNLGLSYFEEPNMADIWISKYAKEFCIDTYVLSHKKGYIELQDVPETICDKLWDNCETQTRIVNEINGFKEPEKKYNWKKEAFKRK